MTSKNPLTLEVIRLQKKAVKEEIEVQKKVISQNLKCIFNPEEDRSSHILSFKTLNTGLAIFDGVLFGFKIISRLRKLFR